jgi:hypothetical protein
MGLVPLLETPHSNMVDIYSGNHILIIVKCPKVIKDSVISTYNGQWMPNAIE